jgi:hypothetical protein
LPETFGDSATLIFHCLPKANALHFITDSYKASSVKGFERAWRGDAPTVQTGRNMTSKQEDFARFLSKAMNKMQVMQLPLTEWQTEK